jgi:hypothetical protein
MALSKIRFPSVSVAFLFAGVHQGGFWLLAIGEKDAQKLKTTAALRQRNLSLKRLDGMRPIVHL